MYLLYLRIYVVLVFEECLAYLSYWIGNCCFVVSVVVSVCHFLAASLADPARPVMDCLQTIVHTVSKPSANHEIMGISKQSLADVPVSIKVLRLSRRVSFSQLRIIIRKRIIAGEFLNESCSPFETATFTFKSTSQRNFSREIVHTNLFTLLAKT